MSRIKLSTVLLVLALAASSVLAETAYVNIEQRFSAEQRHATGIDTLSAEQLVRLNEVLRAEASRAEAEQRQNRQAPAGGTFAGFNDAPIKSRVKGAVSGWEPGTVFELENGQSWKVLKGSMKLRKPMSAPEIIVVPGVAGRWFLQVDEDLPKARVYRID